MGAQHKHLGNQRKVHKNHAYNVIRLFEDSVVVAGAFDGAVSVEEVNLCRLEAENLFNAPRSCIVHAVVHGSTVEGRLVMHQGRHPYAHVHWLYTRVSQSDRSLTLQSRR